MGTDRKDEETGPEYRSEISDVNFFLYALLFFTPW